MIAAVLGADELAKMDAENLLFQARAQAFNGRKALPWYAGELTDDQRLVLRPEIRSLQAAARKADEPTAPHLT
jgi:hypothetical protein